MRARGALGVIAVILLAGPFVASASERAYFASGWTLSDSSTDPFSNFGPATADTITVYIWLWCARPETGGAASASFELSGPLILSTQMSPGVVDAAPHPALFDLTFTGCPSGTFLVGEVSCHGGGAPFFSLCADPLGTMVGCEQSSPEELAWIGYSAGDEFSCISGHIFFIGSECKPPTAISSESWGAVKEKYLEH